MIPADPRDAPTILDSYALEVGDPVAVFLLVTTAEGEGQPVPELYVGTVRSASTVCLVLTLTTGRLARIPWHAIAAIEDDVDAAAPKHPGLTE